MQPQVFVNRILNMKKIKFIGLDMDHTLIRYHTQEFEALVYQIIVDTLIRDNHYPTEIRKFSFHFDSAIRGLIIDSKNGNILKLSRFSAIRESYHGTKPISYVKQQEIYRSIYVDLKDPNYMAIDTSFSIAFCVLYAQLVDYKDDFPACLPDYSQIAKDVISSVDKAHADGRLKSHIAAHLDKYVYQDPNVVKGINNYREYGKYFFILTNSDYHYCKLLLDYAINPFLESGKTWEDIFQYVITFANKPRFFYDNLPFLYINPLDGSMKNTIDIKKPGIYQGGCAKKFTEDLQLNGDEILYIGDHIYGDILRLKKDCNWRTALVVEELGNEIKSQKESLAVQNKIVENMSIKTNLEQEYIQIYTKYAKKTSSHHYAPLYEIQKKIAKIDTCVASLLREEQAFYNKNWGRIFRSGAEESYFAYQVERYACIYMEQLSDLLDHSPITYFRAHRRLLAHDL